MPPRWRNWPGPRSPTRSRSDSTGRSRSRRAESSRAAKHSGDRRELVAEVQQDAGEAVRRLDLRTVADALHQLEPGPGHLLEDPLGALVKHQPIPDAPYHQKARRDPVKPIRIVELRQQSVSRGQIAGHGGPVLVV